MSFNRKEHKTIGTAVINDIDKLMEWLALKESKNFPRARWSRQLCDSCPNTIADPDTFRFINTLNLLAYRDAEDVYEYSYQQQFLKESHDYLSSLGLSFDLLYVGEDYVIICDSRYSYFLPLEFVTIEEYKNYDNLPVSALKSIGSDAGTSLIPAGVEDISVDDVKSRMEEKTSEIEKVKLQVKALEEEKREKLEELKRQLEETYKDKFSLIEQKMQELNLLKADLEKQLLMLDTEIYGIRCYNGETVKFVKLSDGTPCGQDMPVVIHQKIRFLDEEMGKLLSIYAFDGSDYDLRTFEKALVIREDIKDTFLPQKRCVCFIKVSRSGLIQLPSEQVANMLDTYEKYHGKTIGILIRNGEQIFIGWTSEDRVDLRDEKAFYGNSKTVSDEEEQHVDKESSQSEKISRYFIYSILQGVFDHGKIISIPERINILKPSPYILFSMADAWIEDNRFGQFADIVERTQRPFKKGDMILTTMRITRDDRYNTKSRYERWNNDRGRGDKNRTHDAYLSDCTLYPVNCIDRTDIYKFYYLQYPWMSYENDSPKTETVELLQGPPVLNSTDMDILNHEKWGHKLKGKSPEEIYELLKGMVRWLRFDELHGESIYTNFHESIKRVCIRRYHHTELEHTRLDYFLSAQKEANWLTGKSANANLMFYENEVLNLTFLNSVWVRYAINNRKVGSFRIGGTAVDYAQALKYLNKALSYLDEREKEEAALLSTYMELYEDWQVDLSEWKLENDIHVLTDTRAKRFAQFKKQI